MFKNTKVIAVGAGIVAIVFIVLIISLFSVLAKEKREKVVLREELAQVMKERKRLSLEIEDLKLIKSDLETKVGGLEAEAKSLAENYEREKSQNDVVRSNLSRASEELKIAEGKLKGFTGEKEKLKEMLDDERTRYNELKKRVDKLVEVKTVLEDKVRNIVNKQGIELERIVVKASGELEGKVVVVNREYNFIVVDIGMEDDIELGDFLTVFRNGKYVGEVQVEKIYDTMSAATIVKEGKPGAIMVHDNVIVRRN